MIEKEKAKRYDEAVINCSRLWESGEITRENYEYIFPELVESEDKKIKKSLINYINAHGNGGDFTKEEYISWLEKQSEQKQEWSLQDEKNLDNIFCAIRLDNALSNEKQDRLICWLQQYRPYIHKDKKPVEWSEEDSIICQEVVHVIDNCERFEQERNHKNCVDFRHYQVLREWLKSLKERVQPQPKPTWSEEEEVKINRIVAFLKNLNVADNDIILKDADWLKSLKRKIEK